MFENETDLLDQHFLTDQSVIDEFINSANIQKSDIIVEIGPGKGVITKRLAFLAKEVICIEKDERLKDILDSLIKKYPNIKVIYGSALDVFIPSCNKIVTSLPYSITEPFINKMIRGNFQEIIMITGKRFADSVINKEVNVLSELTNSFYETTRIIDIPPTSFEPNPRVMSSLIKLTRLNKDYYLNNNQKYIIRELFFNNDKKIKNSLLEALINIKKITKKEAKEIIKNMQIDDIILNKNMSNISNEDLKILESKIIDI